jgi:hypothetical protein
MRFKLLCLFGGFICGYLMISWMPNVEPFIFTNFITDLVFNPLKSFLAMISFFVGFLANAVLIRSAVEETVFFFSGRKFRLGELAISYGVAGSFYFLFQLNLLLTSLFLMFSAVYGMMSIDFQRKRRYKNDV